MRTNNEKFNIPVNDSERQKKVKIKIKPINYFEYSTTRTAQLSFAAVKHFVIGFINKQNLNLFLFTNGNFLLVEYENVKPRKRC